MTEDLYPLISFLPRYSHLKTHPSDLPELLPAWRAPGEKRRASTTRSSSLPVSTMDTE